MKKIWDKVGITFSLACVIHCIGILFLPALFPALKLYVHQSWIHIVMGLIILVISPIAFIPGLKKHGLSWILFTAITGLIFIFAGLMTEGTWSDLSSHSLSIAGSMTLIFAHLMNLKHSRKFKNQCC